MSIARTHQCGLLRKEDEGQDVQLQGWVDTRRDLGGVIFIDVRDRSGIIQAVFHPEQKEALELADKVRSEYVIAVKGKVTIRDKETVNSKIATGEIEIHVTEAEITNAAKTPPFAIEDDIEVDEAVRLKYRYMDLRRPIMQRTLQLRHKATKLFRDFLDEQGFLEIETPVLTKSTPEGARDYLVPSRQHEGQFFALPQSPQLFKQLLMVSGMERYFQIVRCFRDEDLRADRQPEFTQVDIETSFVPMEELQEMMETLMARLFKETIDVEVERPFQRLTYADAMNRYGSDKPDLRFGLELKDVSDVVQDSNFKVFTGAVSSGGQVKGLNAKGCGHYTRKELDDLTEYAKRYGAKGLAWMLVREDEIKSPIAKFFSAEQLAELRQILGAEDGDLLLFVADQKSVVADTLGALRVYFGQELKLINENEYRFCWITDFPLVEYDQEAKRYTALHHPFTMPREEDVDLMESNPEQVHAKAYDMVLNGYEIGGGSMRIYQRDIQEKMFKLLGFTPEEAHEKFGFLLDAFEYGTPPHGGIAFGLDRIMMILAGRRNLREVIAFPKTSSGNCLMTNAPSAVEPAQLKELHIEQAQKKEK